ncbi:hypothetical protein AMATHDRAFT_6933 [Amanita thiersii Skay4041]|uniref:Uncharacterized protein n=1 Tax=Amanita thiersii Skay4041 TaxID=703135 RepID=A0A2A9NG86_9AGAR|nr:hypothetical protein AMATHDRAFT_6933 [Amanita thiersii Skay4041]
MKRPSTPPPNGQLSLGEEMASMPMNKKMKTDEGGESGVGNGDGNGGDGIGEVGVVEAEGEGGAEKERGWIRVEKRKEKKRVRKGVSMGEGGSGSRNSVGGSRASDQGAVVGKGNALAAVAGLVV